MLYFFVFVLAACGLIYEILLATYSSYLLGDTVVQFSLTIGFFLCGLGIGSFFSKRFTQLFHTFFWVEILLGLLGGFSVVIIQFLYVYFFAYTEVFIVLYYCLVLSIAILVGLEIPLIIDLLYVQQEKKYTHSIKELIGDVFSYDYLGALVATIIFPFVLLPYIGLLYTALLVGVCNIVTAALFLMHKDVQRQRHKKHYTVARTVVGVSLIFLLVSFVPLTNYVGTMRERVFYKDQIVYQEQSDYQHIVLTKKGEKYTLFLDGKVQFVSLDEKRYHNALWYPAQKFLENEIKNYTENDVEKDIENNMENRVQESDNDSTSVTNHYDILIMGAGDGLLVRTIYEHIPDDVPFSIDLVELDPAMTRFARDHHIMTQLNENSLTHSDVSLIHADAMDYVRDAIVQGKKYDIVIADFPDPRNLSLTKLYTKEFYGLIRQITHTPGLFVTQASNAFFAKEAFASIQKTMQEGFSHAVIPYHVYIPSFGDWGFVASIFTGTGATDPMMAKLRHDEKKFGIQRYFDADYHVAEQDILVNTLDNHILLQYYLQGWQRFGL